MNEPTPKPLILVAEDVEAIAVLIVTFLTNRGYRVEWAADGETCLAKARVLRPALIILDLMLPKIHGMEVLRQIKADPQTKDCGVLICTAKQYKPDQDQARELGAYDVLLKPFEKEELIDIVERYFSGAQGAARSTTVVGQGEPYLPTLTTDRCSYHLWGTRGSIPVSGHGFVRHGGNTACMEVNCGDDTVIVDAGTGVRQLGLKLVKQEPRRIHILITHTHWDHIQGFPFFAPAYVPGFEIIIYGAAAFKKDLGSIFRGQLDRDYFPVQFEDMRANIEFRSLQGDSLQVGPFGVTWEYTQHPAATVGFKFQIGDKTLAYVSDNEFLYGYLGDPKPIALDSSILMPHRRLVDFLAGADLLIGEAQYTNEEYRTKIGWGHSSLSNACLLTRLAQVKRWVVTHHDPLHDDAFLDQKLNLTREILRSLDYPIQVSHGYDELQEYL